MVVAVDTSVLLDIAVPGATHLAESRRRLEAALAQGPAILGEAVFAELCVQFRELARAGAFLDGLGIALVPSSPAALAEAGRAHREYLRRRPAMRCPACRALLPVRSRVLADFLVGAHALNHAEALLTRDRGFYRGYFGGLALFAQDPRR